jgi:hypothetical protein
MNILVTCYMSTAFMLSVYSRYMMRKFDVVELNIFSLLPEIQLRSFYILFYMGMNLGLSPQGTDID